MWYKIKKIYQWTNQVRPSGWKPWANTLIYYSFDNQNLDDSSGKWNNGTWYSWTWTYTTGIKSYWVNLNSTRGIQIPTGLIPTTWDFTFSICINRSNLSSPSLQGILATYQWSSWCMHFNVNSSNLEIAFYWTSVPSTWITVTTWTWYNIILTRSGNVWTLYTNWTQQFQTTIAYTLNSSMTWLVWNWYSNDRHINWVIDEVILENKAWTADEILNYYNRSKSNYSL